MKLFRVTLFILLLMTQYAFSQEQEHTEEQKETQQEEQEQSHEKPASQENQQPQQQLEGTGRVTVTISHDNVTYGVPFTLTFLVDYPEPDEVSVVPPEFSSSLTMEQFVKAPVVMDIDQLHQSGRRSRNPKDNVYTQTSIVFTMIPNAVGRITLDSFTVMSPHGARYTSPIVLVVNPRSEVRRIVSQRLIWEGAPRQAAAGERVTFYLRIQNFIPENSDTYPGSAFFMPQVPQGVILTQNSILAQEKEIGVVLKLTLIPLAEGNFSLPARSINRENVRYDIPALTIRITAPVR